MHVVGPLDGWMSYMKRAMKAHLEFVIKPGRRKCAAHCLVGKVWPIGYKTCPCCHALNPNHPPLG